MVVCAVMHRACLLQTAESSHAHPNVVRMKLLERNRIIETHRGRFPPLYVQMVNAINKHYYDHFALPFPFSIFQHSLPLNS